MSAPSPWPPPALPPCPPGSCGTHRPPGRPSAWSSSRLTSLRSPQLALAEGTASSPACSDTNHPRSRKCCVMQPRTSWRAPASRPDTGRIWSTNPLERLNKVVKRRTDVVGLFPAPQRCSARRRSAGRGSRRMASDRPLPPLRSHHGPTHHPRVDGRSSHPRTQDGMISSAEPPASRVHHSTGRDPLAAPLRRVRLWRQMTMRQRGCWGRVGSTTRRAQQNGVLILKIRVKFRDLPLPF